MIRHARHGDEAAIQALVRACLEEYDLPYDLHDMDRDLADLEGNYPPSGNYFAVLEEEDRISGTVAIARLDAGRCELKRMYLAPALRGRGYGRTLLGIAIEFARAAGYRRIELDTSRKFKEAIRLYQRSGFQPATAGPSCACADLRFVLELTPAVT